MRIIVLDRVVERHPNITKQDVVVAFNSMYIDAPRQHGRTWIGVGTDEKLRSIEMVYIVDYPRDRIVIYHAMTPPTKKFMKEIKMLRKVQS